MFILPNFSSVTAVALREFMKAPFMEGAILSFCCHFGAFSDFLISQHICWPLRLFTALYSSMQKSKQSNDVEWALLL